jgi:hypothetical protein
MLIAIFVISSLQPFILGLILGALGDLRRDVSADMETLQEDAKTIRIGVTELVERHNAR